MSTQPEQNQSEEQQSSENNIDYKSAWIRATADYQNLKKEMLKKQEEYTQYANQGLLQDLLPVIEHFFQGLKYVPEEVKQENWMQGFEQIKKQLDEFMKQQGLERIQTVGQTFDANVHEAVGQQSEKEKGEDEILEEVMGGYTLNGKVLQPAKVIVNHLN